MGYRKKTPKLDEAAQHVQVDMDKGEEITIKVPCFYRRKHGCGRGALEPIDLAGEGYTSVVAWLNSDTEVTSIAGFDSSEINQLNIGFDSSGCETFVDGVQYAESTVQISKDSGSSEVIVIFDIRVFDNTTTTR